MEQSMGNEAPRKAIALMSGGLDSSLAVRMLHDMGIGIIGVHFTGPFCQCNRSAGGCISFARKQADALGVPFSTRALGHAYLDIVANPPHGYGSGMNPCVDCRILMLRRAREMMIEEQADFIMTGEVIGQRPMSQLRAKLALIEDKAGLTGLILRPLCAGNMPVTIPEREGWVDREKLLSISGRGRREQIDLAEKLEIGDYPCPAGGCLLTDKHFAARLREHLDHAEIQMEDIAFLKLGRHFRLPDGSKLAVGRDEPENEKLAHLRRDGDVLLEPTTAMGPAALWRGKPLQDETAALAGEIVAAYSRGSGLVEVTVRAHTAETSLLCESREKEFFAPLKV